jgi:radical SAM superfamily enzyme YgiQ (UPF0313 family)
MKIGLIAMSGIRVRNEELLQLGLTLPGFVERGKVIASLPSLGLLTLAGLTPTDHEVSYLEIADLKLTLLQDDLPQDFDLVAISSFSAQIDEAYELADRFRSRGTMVVLGGLHVTSLPDEAQEHCDAVVVGEGEPHWLRLLKDAQNGALKARYDCVVPEFKLADAPMPAFELLEISKYNRLTVQTTRGCPHKCEFCASSILLTKKYKLKPVEKVLAEIDKIKELWQYPFIEFADDNSFVNPAYWKRLLPELRKRRIHWFTETDISVAFNDELLRLMRRAGCAQVLIGLESPTSEALRGIDARNWKYKQAPQYIEAVRRIQSHGISVNGCLVVGLDGHDSSIFEKIYRFVELSGQHQVQITLPTAFPGTPFYHRLKNEGRLIDETDWRKCTLFDLNFVPARMTGKELVEGFKELVTTLYDAAHTSARESAFKKCMRDGYRARRVSARTERHVAS